MFPIYKSEMALNDIIQQSNKIIYSADISICETPIDLQNIKIPTDNMIEGADKPGLFALKSIMVSTGLNKNYAFFDRKEVWAAKDTPEDKPFNIEHDGHDIIGHITGSEVVDDKMKVVDAHTSIDDLPNHFHILTSAVIYEKWKDKKKEESIKKIISEIKDNKWFVSVEANFSDFDYVLANEDGYKVIYRNEKTAFLTEHLKIYGGTGIYNDQKLGQFIRGITFCGKGLVRKPANPESVILLNSIESLYKSLGYITSSEEIISKENVAMSSEVDLKNENTALKQALEAAQSQIKVINDKNIEAKIAELQEQLKAKDVKLTEANDKLTANASEMIELKKLNQTASEKLVVASAELEKISLSNKRIERAKVLAKEVGVSIEDADSIVDNLVSLNDEAFTKFVSASKDKLTKKTAEANVQAEAEKKAKDEAEAAKVLETAVPSTEPTLVAAVAGVENVRKTVKNFLSKRESK